MVFHFPLDHFEPADAQALVSGQVIALAQREGEGLPAAEGSGLLFAQFDLVVLPKVMGQGLARLRIGEVADQKPVPEQADAFGGESHRKAAEGARVLYLVEGRQSEEVEERRMLLAFFFCLRL